MDQDQVLLGVRSKTSIGRRRRVPAGGATRDRADNILGKPRAVGWRDRTQQTRACHVFDEHVCAELRHGATLLACLPGRGSAEARTSRLCHFAPRLTRLPLAFARLHTGTRMQNGGALFFWHGSSPALHGVEFRGNFAPNLDLVTLLPYRCARNLSPCRWLWLCSVTALSLSSCLRRGGRARLCSGRARSPRSGIRASAEATTKKLAAAQACTRTRCGTTSREGCRRPICDASAASKSCSYRRTTQNTRIHCVAMYVAHPGA